MDSYNIPTRIFIFVLVLVLSMGIVAGAYSISAAINRQDNQPIPLNCSSIENLQTDENNIYFYSDDVLYCYGSDGAQVWQYTLGADADYRVFPYGVAAWQGSNLFLIARDGSMLYSGAFNTPIGSCALCEGYAAIETVVSGKSVLQVIEHNGKVIDTLDTSSLTLLDYGFFGDNNTMWVMTLNTEGTVPLTQVDTYHPARAQTGSIPDSSQVIYKVVLDNNELVLIGTDTMNRYAYTGKEKAGYEKLVYGWHYMDSFVSAKRQAYLFAPTRELESSISIKDMRVITGSSDYNVHFQLPCMSVHAGESAAYAISNQYVFKNVYGTERVLTYELPLYVDQVVAFTDGGMAVVVSEQRVYLVKLP